jgi:hypothetical protein
MLGRVTIYSCAENYRFITLFSQVEIHSEFGANAQMRRICWRCAKFLAGAKLSMAKFGASAWMRQTFLEMRDIHLLSAPNLHSAPHWKVRARHPFVGGAPTLHSARNFFLRHIGSARATSICWRCAELTFYMELFFCAILEVRDIFLHSKMGGGLYISLYMGTRRN